MPEGLGEKFSRTIRGAFRTVGEFGKKALQDYPPDFRIPSGEINQNGVAAAYQRWINQSPDMRFVKDENRYPSFTLAEILWSLGYLGNHGFLDRFIDPYNDDLADFQAARVDAYQALSQLQRAGTIKHIQRDPKKVRTGQLPYYYKIPIEKREEFARIAEAAYNKFYSE